MVRLVRFLLMLVATLTLAGGARAQTFPPLSGRVVDAAHLLSPEQVQQLTDLSAEVEQASTRQLVIATVPDLQGYEIEDYGYRLGRAWGIGEKGANNGIILIVAPKERRVRIEVGYGLEPIMTDALSSQIIDEQILPRFKAGDMAGGIIAGANAIAEQMKLPLEAAETRAAKARPPERQRQHGSGVGGFGVLALFVILFFVLPRLFARAGARRYASDSGVGGAVGQILLWSAIDAATHRRDGWGGGSGWGSGGGDWGGGGGGGFSGGGGSFGGGGASGGW